MGRGRRHATAYERGVRARDRRAMKRSTVWLAALVIDTAAGEPPAAIHPVVAVGRIVTALERDPPRSNAGALRRGVILVAVPAVLAVGIGRTVERIPYPLPRLLLGLFLLKSTFALRALLEAGERTQSALDAGDLGQARSEIRALVSRPAATLDEPLLASAIVESLAENLADAYVAPMLWYAIGGLPAALAYRVVNTADAMVGYHGRYEYLGKAAARVDDLVNVIPARLSAAAIAAVAPLAGGSVANAMKVLRRDRRRTASPNAGWPMAAAAGALGLRLEKPGAYVLGSGGRTPSAVDGAAARRLILSAALLSTASFVALDRWRGRDPGTAPR